MPERKLCETYYDKAVLQDLIKYYRKAGVADMNMKYEHEINYICIYESVSGL